MPSVPLPRLYTSILQDHLARNKEMAFLSGPRQVGKTTVCLSVANTYLNWDNDDHRRVLLRGPSAIAEFVQAKKLRQQDPVLVIDEFHKHPKWKNLLKGFYDTYGDDVRILVTGSSRLNIYRRGSDSLMGRYLLYRMHPLSVAECLRPTLSKTLIQPAMEITTNAWDALIEHGGFPGPFLRRDSTFTRQWRLLRRDQLSREDLREVSLVQDIGSIEVLMQILAEQSSHQLVYSNLAQEIRVSSDTVKRWLDLLCSLHYGFIVRPWFTNLAKAFRKEPKWFMRDWSGITDAGDRAETFVACHLLKAVEGWTDLGLGEFELRYIRDVHRREVDFLVVRDKKPWILVEAKAADTHFSPSLEYFQAKTKAPHAFQVVMDLPFEQVDCFQAKRPVVVPAKTFLSQLL
jgi:predicted AAA+ superfamily ATPase